MVILYLLNKTPLRKLYFKKWGKKWVAKKVEPILPLLRPTDKILDVGSGNGLVAWHLRQKGFNLTLLDIASQEFDTSVKPMVYDGKKIPFKENEFDVALVLSVLHHTENPDDLLAEISRVAKRVVIYEDIYRNTPQRWLTKSMDTFVNLGYSPCPRTNKNDAGWREVFKKLNLNLTVSIKKRVLLFFTQVIYFVEK